MVEGTGPDPELFHVIAHGGHMVRVRRCGFLQIVDDLLDGENVQSTRRHIGRHQNRRVATAEAAQHALALRLAEVPLEGGHMVAVAEELAL